MISLPKKGWMYLGGETWGKTVDGIHCRATTEQALAMEREAQAKRDAEEEARR